MPFTITIDPVKWFRNNDGIVLSPFDEVNRQQIDDNIRDSFRQAFRDNDHDGHPDGH